MTKYPSHYAAMRKAFINGAVQAFLEALIDNDCILEDNIFVIMSEEAIKRGYVLEAHQQGIAGTLINFNKA